MARPLQLSIWTSPNRSGRSTTPSPRAAMEKMDYEDGRGEVENEASGAIPAERGRGRSIGGGDNGSKGLRGSGICVVSLIWMFTSWFQRCRDIECVLSDKVNNCVGCCHRKWKVEDKVSMAPHPSAE